MAPSWNPNDYSNAVVRKFVQELINLVHEYSLYVYRDAGKTGLMIKDKKSAKKLIEYWPNKNNKNKMVKTVNDHKAANVADELSSNYHNAIDNLGPSVTESNMAIFLDYLKKIITQLNELKNIDKSNVFNKMSLDENEEDYLPVRADFENACRKCSQFLWETSGIPIDRIFEIMEKDLLRTGHKLHKDWRIISEKNIALWAKANDEKQGGTE